MGWYTVYVAIHTTGPSMDKRWSWYLSKHIFIITKKMQNFADLGGSQVH